MPKSFSADSSTESLVRDLLLASIKAKQGVLDQCVPQINAAGQMIGEALTKGHKLLLFGNGGSAADAQHLAAEFVGHFRIPRKGLPAIALTANSSTITAIGNDDGYEQVFSRQIEAFASTGDILLGITTSGKSPNVNRAMDHGRVLGCRTIALTGKGGGTLAPKVEIPIVVPSDDTQLIQECHIAIGHILCRIAEDSVLSCGSGN
ncbi:MAG: D-sedoheptulose 7-phosphate isomerase [Candidatus Omnitrophica bacterium]|nr:D-sedoheptulose 7-phosphate isomerase [Candidatus Omnitrophota bacterium]